MLTNLDPKYTFEDGVAFVVDDWKNVKTSDLVYIYIPSCMIDIEKSEESKETIVSTGMVNTVFLNGNHPTIPATMTELNYISAHVSSGLVMGKSNETLYDRYKADPENSSYIRYIPMKTDLKAGDEVEVWSDLNTLNDLSIS